MPTGRTLNPTIIASEADANNTSDSVIAPTPLWMMLTCISSVDNFWNESVNASTDPSTSPFNMMLSSLKSPRAIRLPISSKVICRCVRTDCSRTSWVRFAAICFASFSSSNTLNRSPAVGAPSSPSKDTGVDGPASVNSFPRSSCIARTLPLC